MGFYFRKSLNILPGVRLNLSKSGPRLSVGTRGARVSLGPGQKPVAYGGIGPVRYRETISPRAQGLWGILRRFFGSD